MRIRSVSIQNYKVHRNLTVTFDDQLTVIGGPNESGKSTLVEAIHRALFMRFKSGGTELESMQSHFGGQPEVAVVFEVNGRTVQIRKKFRGQSGSATLEEQGATTLTGDAAEQRLADLLGEASAAKRWDKVSWSHLWVWQGESFVSPMDGTNDRAGDLVSRFQANGAAVVQQSALDARLAARFAEKVGLYYTATGAIRKNAPLDAAIEKHRAAAQLVAERRAALEKLFEAARQLENARAIIKEATVSLTAREQELREAQTRHKEIEALRNRTELESKDAEAAQKEYEKLVQREQEIKALRERVAQLTEQLAPMQQQAAQLLLEEQAATTARTEAGQQLNAIDDAVRSAGIRVALANAYVTRFDLRQQQQELDARQTRARETSQAFSQLRTAMAALPAIDAQRCQAIEEAARALEVTEAKLGAIATRVELLAADTLVELAGTTLVPGQAHIITTDAELTVGAGVRVRITPGGGASVAEAQQAVHDARRKLTDLLQETGIPSATEARRVLDQRTALGNELTQLENVLKDLAPADLEARALGLAGSLAEAEAEVLRRREQGAVLDEPTSLESARELVASLLVDLRDAENHQQALLQARTSATVRIEAAERARQQHTESMAAQQHELEQANKSLASQLEVHGSDVDRAQALATAEAAHKTAAGVLAATRNAIAALDPDGVSEQLRMLTSMVSNLRERRENAQRDELVAQKELEQDGSRDPHAELALAEAQERDAAAQLDRVRLQAQAVRELRDLYTAEQRQLDEQFSRPLRAQVDKYLRVVLPDSGLQVQYDGKAFGGLAIARGAMQTRLEFDALSTGAREQVATALRLGVAEVLAAGHDGCLPVVFDDAFAYSDPERLRLLRQMLFRAAESGLQVIVLSCNPVDYDGLGQRITLDRPVEAAYAGAPQRAATVGGVDDDGDDTSDTLAPGAGAINAGPVSVDDRQAFLTAIAARGGSSGNQSLRQDLGWEEDRYLAVRESLLAANRIILGRGRGGSVSIAGQ